MTKSLTTTATALAPSSSVAEWHAHLDLQVRAGQMAKDTATTYRQGMRKLTEWASQQESWNRTLILEWVAALKAEGKFAILPALDIVRKGVKNMNCKNNDCQMELCELADDDEFYEIYASGKPRYSGYCADCYDDLRSSDLEDQLEKSMGCK